MVSLLRLLRSHRRRLPALLLLLTATAGFWWHFGSPRPSATWELSNAVPVFLSPDGKMLATVARQITEYPGGSSSSLPHGPVRLLDVETGRELFQVLDEAKGVFYPRISPDSRWLVVENQENQEARLAVWDITTGRLRAVLATTTQEAGMIGAFCTNFRFSPDGRLLAYERADGRAVILWDLVAGQPRATLEDACRPFEFTPDGQTLATATTGTPGKLWDVATGRERAELPSAFPVESLTFSPDGSLLACGRGQTGRRWRLQEVEVRELPSGRLRATLPHADLPSARPFRYYLVVSPYADRMIISGHQPGTVELLDTHTLAPLAVLEVGEEQVAWALSPDGRTLAVGLHYAESGPGLGWRSILSWLRGRRPNNWQSVRRTTLFDLETGREIGSVPGDLYEGFTADGRAIWTTSAAGELTQGRKVTFNRWSVPSRRPLGLYVGAASLLGLSLLWLGRRRWLRRARPSAEGVTIRPVTDAGHYERPPAGKVE